MTTADRQLRFAQRMKRRGLIKIWLYVPRRFMKMIRVIERELREPEPNFHQTLKGFFDESES